MMVVQTRPEAMEKYMDLRAYFGGIFSKIWMWRVREMENSRTTEILGLRWLVVSLSKRTLRWEDIFGQIVFGFGY